MNEQELLSLKQAAVQVGSVVQINPENCPRKAWGGVFVLVTEVKSFGIQGFTACMGNTDHPPGAAYIRLSWDRFEYIGESVWSPAECGECRE